MLLLLPTTTYAWPPTIYGWILRGLRVWMETRVPRQLTDPLLVVGTEPNEGENGSGRN